jgi:hypothetical protein
LISIIFYVEYVANENPPGEYENDLKNGGFRPFINYLKSFIPNDQRIRLNCEVTRVKFVAADRQLLVEVNDLGEQRKKMMRCDHIIWTTSLGYLKQHFQTIFADERDLIQQKQNAITNIGFGTINKVRDFSLTIYYREHVLCISGSTHLQEKILERKCD